MTIEKAILSAKEPKETNTAWVQPKGDSLQLNIFNNGKWRPIAGSGNSTTVTNKYTSDPNAPMLSLGNFFEGAAFEAATKLGFDTNNKPTSEQMEQIFNELKSYKFATPKQGNAVLVDYDLENGIFTFQCDDGSIITFTKDNRDYIVTGLRPGIDGYIIWQTTRDKLPVRESQEETDPGSPIGPESVKPGLLGDISPTDPSTEVVYTVMNNNTGEIVDPLELHKLTNVIWYMYNGIYYPFYLQEVADFYSKADAITNNDYYISIWTNTDRNATNLKYISVYLFYDYTLKPNSMSKIQTTNSTYVSDINSFFN